MGQPKTPPAVVLPTMLSLLGKACAKMDLTAVHEILLKTGYRDEEGADNEVNQIFFFSIVLIDLFSVPPAQITSNL